MIPLLLLILASPAQGSLERIDLLTGPQVEQRFGATFTQLGDIDQDGISDFAVGSPGYVSPLWAWGGGKVEAFSGADRSLLYTVKPNPGVDSLLGLTLNTLGDWNQDGIQEILVGAGGLAAAYVVDGANGQRIMQVVTNSNGQVGMTSMVIGDMNQDGLPEFALGLPSETVDGIWGAGRVLLFDGSTGIQIKEIRGSVQFQSLGKTMCAPGDLNGDGMPDLMMNGSAGSTVYSDGFTVYSGMDLLPMYSQSRHSLLMSISAMEAFHDFNQDGTLDFLISGYQRNFDDSWVQGVTRILSGVDGSLLHQINGFQFADFGSNLATLDDVNGDGVTDFGTVEFHLNPLWQIKPHIRIFNGSDASEMASFSSEDFGFFTVNLSGLSDIDQDGRAEIALRISGETVGGGTPGFHPGGELYLIGLKQ